MQTPRESLSPRTSVRTMVSASALALITVFSAALTGACNSPIVLEVPDFSDLPVCDDNKPDCTDAESWDYCTKAYPSTVGCNQTSENEVGWTCCQEEPLDGGSDASKN